MKKSFEFIRVKFIKSQVGALVLAAAMVGLPSSASALNVFLDYTSFTDRLNQISGAIGGQEATIKANIKIQLETAYSDYSVTFHESNPGGSFETLRFGNTSGAGNLGVATGIDFFNKTADVADVFSANFNIFVEGGEAIGTQVAELSTALAGTAAHELGHNLGLRHYDAFGDPGIGDGTTGGDAATGGQQNAHIMATGSTGLSEAGRETQRTFSELSNIMLEHSDGMGGSGTIYAEGTNGNNLDGLLQSFDTISAGFKATVINGNLVVNNDYDEYTFTGKTGERLLAKVVSAAGNVGGAAFIGSTFDSVLELRDSNNNLVLSQDDIYYGATSVNSGGTSRTRDSMILNYVLNADDVYTLRVDNKNSFDTGEYGLIFGKDTQPIPEPSTLVLAFTGLCGLAYLRRRDKVRVDKV
jgi:hypothetical protein